MRRDQRLLIGLLAGFCLLPACSGSIDEPAPTPAPDPSSGSGGNQPAPGGRTPAATGGGAGSTDGRLGALPDTTAPAATASPDIDEPALLQPAPALPAEPAPPSVVTQTNFDFTVAQDRQLFAEKDMRYVGAIGPYAIYRVTGPEPRLVGPQVQYVRDGAYAMLCGGHAYYTGGDGSDINLVLYAGRDGQERLVQAQVAAQTEGSCAAPKDDFGNPLEPTPTVSGPEDVEQLTVAAEPAPPMGSTVLLRRIALNEDRQHNQSHVIPPVCCDGDNCWLN